MQEQQNFIPELLSITDLERYYSFNTGTIIRERWEQKKIKQKKKIKVRNLSGFGFTTPAVLNGRKVMYRKADVEKWITNNLEDLSPEEKISKVS